jgi:hypothetical protein
MNRQWKSLAPRKSEKNFFRGGTVEKTRKSGGRRTHELVSHGKNPAGAPGDVSMLHSWKL